MFFGNDYQCCPDSISSIESWHWRGRSCVPQVVSGHSKKMKQASQAELGITLINSMKLFEPWVQVTYFDEKNYLPYVKPRSSFSLLSYA